MPPSARPMEMSRSVTLWGDAAMGAWLTRACAYFGVAEIRSTDKIADRLGQNASPSARGAVAEVLIRTQTSTQEASRRHAALPWS